jgi:hypothetical protein
LTATCKRAGAARTLSPRDGWPLNVADVHAAFT